MSISKVTQSEPVKRETLATLLLKKEKKKTGAMFARKTSLRKNKLLQGPIEIHYRPTVMEI